MAERTTISRNALARTLRLVGPDLRAHRKLMAGGTGALLLEVVFRVLEPWPMKFVIDAVSISLGADLATGQAPATLSLLVWCGVALLGIVGLRALSNYLATVAFALVGSRAATTLRARVFRHVQGLSQYFHSHNRSADTVQRIVSDVGRLQEVAVTAGLPLVANMLTLAVMFIVMLVLDPLLALVVVGAMGLFLLGSVGTSKQIAVASRKTRKGEGQLANTAQESLSSIRIVQAYGLEEHLNAQFSSANHRSLKEGVRARRLAAGLERRTDVIVGIATALVLVGGGLRVVDGTLTPGDLVLFTTYLRTTMKPLRDMAKYTGRIARASASGERVADLMEVEPVIVSPRGAHTIRRVHGWVRLDSVVAGYGDTTVLRGVSLTVRPGERIAVIGPSGSGKSTLASLLVRAMDPTRGDVTLDGHPLRELDLAQLRAKVSLLPQEAVLFTGTVRENIRLGRQDATDAEIDAAAQAAHAHEFILELPLGYDTVVGERGGTLSGGQRQRIAIARALLRNSPVVVLDEATTGLDPESASLVLDAIGTLVQDRTVIAITHDVEMALRSDRVVWLEDGRILMEGRPRRLLADDPVFREWVTATGRTPDTIRMTGR